MVSLTQYARAVALLAAAAFSTASAENSATGTIKDVKHIVMLMQENRAFDHYLGSMSGVRGFKDPNVKIGDNGLPIWYQYVSALNNLGQLY